MSVIRRFRDDDNVTKDFVTMNHGACKAEHTMRYGATTTGASYWIECDCGVRGPEDRHERGAITKWNEQFKLKSGKR